MEVQPSSPETPETQVFDTSSAPESSPRRGSWAGRIVIAVMAVALIAGAIAVTQDDGDSGDTSLQPLALALGGSGGGRSNEAGAAADMMMVAPMDYRLEGTLPDLGSTAPVYKLVQPELTADDVAAMATAVGVEGTPQPMDGGWIVDSPDGSLAVYPAPGSWSVNYSPYSVLGGIPVTGEPMTEPGAVGSGGSVDGVSDPALAEDAAAAADAEARAAEEEKVVSEDEGDTPVSSDDTPTSTVVDDPILVDPMPINPDADPTGTTPPANVPSAADAEQIARDLLDAMGVLDGSEWTVTVTDSGMMGWAAACSSDEPECDAVEETQEYVTSRMVMFARQVDGTPVSGLEWSVEVGDEGVVQYLWGTLADLEDLGDYPLQSTQAVYDQLVAGDGYGYGGGPMPLAEDMLAAQGSVDEAGVASDSVETASTGTDTDAVVTTLAPSDDGTCSASDTDGDGVMDTESCSGFEGECPPGADCIVPDPGICDDPAADCASPPSEPCTREAGNDCAVPNECVDGEECIPTEPPDVCVDGEECITPLPPECDPAVADCGLIDPMPFPEPEPTVVVVTGAELSSQVIWGTDAGVDVQYLVPSYRFLGHFADGAEWSADLVALDESMVIAPEVPDTTVVPDTEPPVTLPPETVPETTIPDDTTPDDTTPDDTIVCTEAPCDDPTTTVTVIEEPPGTVVCVTTPCNETLPPDGDIVCVEAPCDDPDQPVGAPVTTIPAE